MNWDNATTADSWPGRPNKRTMRHFMRANGLSALTDVSSRICLPNPLEIYLHATNTQFVSVQSFHIIRANMRRPAHDWPDLLDAAAEPSCSMFSALCASPEWQLVQLCPICAGDFVTNLWDLGRSWTLTDDNCQVQWCPVGPASKKRKSGQAQRYFRHQFLMQQLKQRTRDKRSYEAQRRSQRLLGCPPALRVLRSSNLV